MSDKPRNPADSPKRGKRKPYAKPVIQTYGAIRVITENLGSMTLADGGTNPKVKTN
ncbi:MAG: hypothetical protein H7Y14_10090 [Burkholderiales bacterium]|nr:hypothetical protein [Burkholderiales bacterium]